MLTRHRADIGQKGLSVERGLLKQHSRRRRAYYTVAWCADRELAGRGTHAADSGGNRSLHSDASSLHNDASSIHSDVSSIHNGDSGLLEQAVEKQLIEIAEPVRCRQRAARELVEATIVELCVLDYFSLQRLAELLRRHPIGLRDHYINPLVRAGRLTLRYPDKPNHSQQAYRTVDRSSV
jgi:ATP-dependent DNA helicase RecG